MKIHDVKQGSDEWHQLRLGIPTASCFGRLVTPKTKKLSTSRRGYMIELIAEKLLGKPLDSGSSMWMERGKEMESAALAYYRLERGEQNMRAVGFITTDDGLVGCSPDHLVGEDGGLEIKCPMAKNHVANLIELTTDYEMQCQGCMMITDRKWWDIMSYNDDLPTVLYRAERDEETIALLKKALEKLAVETAETMADLHERYTFISKG